MTSTSKKRNPPGDNGRSIAGLKLGRGYSGFGRDNVGQRTQEVSVLPVGGETAFPLTRGGRVAGLPPLLSHGLDGRGPGHWVYGQEGSGAGYAGSRSRMVQVLRASAHRTRALLGYDPGHAQVARGLAYELGHLEVHRWRGEHATVPTLRVEGLASLHFEL